MLLLAKENLPVNHGGGASKYWQGMSLIVILLTLGLAGCAEENCQFESDCATGQSCIEGACVYLCNDDEDCRSGFSCVAGRCELTVADGGCDEAGCPDFGLMDMMSMPVDSALSIDMMTEVDASSELDMAADMIDATTSLDAGGSATPQDAAVGPGLDSAVMGGGFDLTGLYTVTQTVLVSTGGDFEDGATLRTICALTRLQGTRYRLEVYNLDGVRQYLIPAVDFVAPGGAGRYQFEYTQRRPSGNDCDEEEVRFERGRYSSTTHGFQLTGVEERTFSLVGDSCSGGYIVRTDTVWSPLP